MEATAETKELVTIETPAQFEEWIKNAKLETVQDFTVFADAYKCIELLIKQAEGVKITDHDSLTIANEYAQKIKMAHKLIEGAMEPRRKELYDTYKNHKALMDGYCGPLKEAEKEIKNGIIDYNLEQERIRQDEAEKARIKAEAEAEAERERERLRKEADEAADKGDEERFEELAAQVEDVSAQDHMPVAQPAYMPPKGTTIKKNWQFEVNNLSVLIEAVIKGKAPSNFIIPNEKAIKAWVKAVGKSQEIPGIRVFDKGTVSIRSAT
jgi:hypothetical protein